MEEDLTQQILLDTRQSETGIKQLTQAIYDLTKAVGGLGDDVHKSFANLNDSVGKVNESIKELKGESEESGKAFKDSFIGVAATIGIVVEGIERVGSKVLGLIEQGNAITETSNMYYQSLSNVSNEYKNATTQASQFYTSGLAYQRMLHQQLGLNTEQMEKYQAMYFNMLNGQQGITSDLAYRMSENLTNLAIDMSSLFNTDIETMSQKLQSGITGQAKALRQFGIDVTEASMASTLLAYGINESVKSLSYGEKELLRYLTIVRQVNYAEGDFANTFTTSANQLKVLQDEIKTLAQSTGLIFSSTLSNAIIFARAVVRVLQNMVEAIARFLHIDLTGTAENEGKAINGITDKVNNGIGGIGKSIGNATKKAKEFKKQLMGFDEINNITPPGQSSGGAGGLSGGAGGISSALLSALDKADWDLGIGNKVDEINRKIEKLAENPVFKALVAGGIGLGLTKAVSGFVKLASSIGLVSGSVTGLSGAFALLTPFLAIGTIALLVDNYDKAKFKVDEWTQSYIALQKTVDKTYDGMEFETDQFGKTLVTGLEAIGLGIDNLTGGAISRFSDKVADSMMESEGFVKGFGKSFNELKDKISDVKYEFELAKEANVQTIDTAKQYVTELGKITTANGTIRLGYEEQAKTITEELAKATGLQIEVSGNQIKINGEVKKSYKEIEDAINKAIAAKEKELKMVELETEYKKLIELRVEAMSKARVLQEQLTEAENELTKAIESGDQAKIDSAQKAYDETKNSWNAMSMEATKLSNDINKVSQEMKYETTKDITALTADLIKSRAVNGETVQRIYKENKDNWKKTLEDLNTDTKGNLLVLTTSMDTLNEDLAQDWLNLAKSSDEGKKEFNKSITEMDGLTAVKLLTMTKNFEDLDENARLAIWKFAETAPDKYAEAVDQMPEETRKAYLAVMQNIKSTTSEAGTEGQKVANKIKDPIENVKDSSGTWGSHIVTNLAYGISRQTGRGGVLAGAVAGVVSLITRSLQHSVPKEGPLHDDDKWGIHFVQNLANGINSSAYLVDNAVQGIVGDISDPFTSNTGIVVDKNLNANAMVDYSQVSGQISTSIQSGNIAQGIAVAVQQALQRANIQVNVEAHADAGIIVETAVEGINNLTRQTNEFPLEIPI